MSARTLCALAAGVLSILASPLSARGADPFARAVDLSPLRSLGVQHEGRIVSFETFARRYLAQIAGPGRIDGQPPVFTCLDMLLAPDRYEDSPLVYVRHATMRRALVRALGEHLEPDETRTLLKAGRIAPRRLLAPQAQALLDTWSRDLVRTAAPADEIRRSLAMLVPDDSGAVHVDHALASAMAIVPPPPGTGQGRWLGVRVLDEDTPADALEPARAAWHDLRSAWHAHDADASGRALSALRDALAHIDPASYPRAMRLALESRYVAGGSMTWVWIVCLGACVPLLMSLVYRWPRARRVGLSLFVLALTLHTGAIALRWYLSGRWPNANMFEAVTTSVWFGAIVALALETWLRRTPVRDVFALAASFASMGALMAASFVPRLDSHIANRMPILHDVWLYIHTNVVIASYALIAMAGLCAAMLLVARAVGSPRRTPGDAAQVLDGATMILLQLAFVLLFAGIVMGAIWADHSWGRPWGWDPKEVFALNTFIVFVVLVHVRLKVRDKALWTAVLALAGCAVMLFNWIVINYVITGLHSYA